MGEILGAYFKFDIYFVVELRHGNWGEDMNNGGQFLKFELCLRIVANFTWQSISTRRIEQ